VAQLFGVAAITVPSNAAATGGALRATSNELFGAAAPFPFIKSEIDLNDAGVDRSTSCLEFHITDHHRTGLWIDFPMPKRRRVLLNVEISATMLHDRWTIEMAQIGARRADQRNFMP
jgi:hypothetical protein